MASRRWVVVDRERFELKLYVKPLLSSKFRLLKTYPIAIGKDGYETPRGLFAVDSKDSCPDWRIPESDWAPEAQWGEIVPCGDPRNPIRHRWIGIWGKEGIGIHGVPPESEDSIGTAASHGCIRMRRQDILDLYPRVPKNTHVQII